MSTTTHPGGRGITASASAMDLARAAVHEAGHAVAVVLGGHALTSAVLHDPDTHPDGCCGSTSWRTPPRGADAVLGPGLEDEITMAGPVAEAIFVHGPDYTIHQLQDVMATTGRGDRDALTAAGALVWPVDVKAAMVALAPVTRDLAQELLSAGRLSHTTVATALGVGAIPHRAVSSLGDPVWVLANAVPVLRGPAVRRLTTPRVPA